MKRKPVVLAMKVGNIGEPTTLCLGASLAGELGVLLAHQQAQVGADQAEHDQGMSRTWMMKNRGMMIPLPGNWPPQRNETM